MLYEVITIMKKILLSLSLVAFIGLNSCKKEAKSEMPSETVAVEEAVDSLVV